jgi:hypothetical protein
VIHRVRYNSSHWLKTYPLERSSIVGPDSMYRGIAVWPALVRH